VLLEAASTSVPAPIFVSERQGKPEDLQWTRSTLWGYLEPPVADLASIPGLLEALDSLAAVPDLAAWAPLVRELFAFLAPEPARDRTDQ
jgi:hypothetical protein